MFLPVDLTEIHPDVRQKMHELLTTQYGQRMLEARRRQIQAADHYDRNRPRAKDGLGGMVRVVDPEILDWAGWKYGHDIAFGDPEFWPWLDKQDNFSGVFRVRHRRVKDGVGWTPPQADPRPTGIVIREAGHKRFTKHYPS